ncbi:hypothetical protein N0V93_007087 [Gnomoniopsis smithogilvyi]|uniref:Heme oxygenase n=1 Tax=Gnomoniopsis smithogilvyi TaxID=1191159 RepID=A0A9W9CW84_9PEZI|nr:hypothetical protein N0V93_007087 [Gnomoniopsis smithogilvyi]
MAASTTSEERDAPSLSHQINASIAASHTTLNRLILDRMPRAVPPYTDNPSTYITGLLHVGAVYIAFESLWQNLLGIHSEIAPFPYSFPFNNPEQQQQQDGAPKITARTRRVLEEAYSPTMLRAARIKADVQTMTGWSDHVFEQQLRAAGTSGRLGKLTLHIRDVVNAKPHFLLAYAYTLYLALLSGGSYIRTELMYLDRDFWEATPTPVMPGMVECKPDKSSRPRRRQGESEDENEDDDSDAPRRLPLDFLDFDPPLGTNPRQQTKILKSDFKVRLAAADALLTEPERSDIVAETALIFQHLEGMVAQLDKVFDGPNTTSSKTYAHRALGGVGGRLRDSIAIAKGRLLRTRRKSSGGSLVTATVSALAEEDASGIESKSSRLSSVSNSSGGDKDAVQAVGFDAQHEQDDDLLARDAVVPRDGFRTVRYGSDLVRSKRRATPSNSRNGRDHHAPHGFDGASDRCCPMSRGSAIKVTTPDYALYAIVSNLVLLGGMMGVFIAWLWMRHGEPVTGL